jgi:OTU domain-containing protein 5
MDERSDQGGEARAAASPVACEDAATKHALEAEPPQRLPLSPRFVDPQFGPPPGPEAPRGLYLHKWLDVQDDRGSWLEAQIACIDESTRKVKVHYKGYEAARYDEWLPDDSPRLAPLHSHTRPLLAPAPPPLALLSPGVELDALDSIDKWRLARVLAVSAERRQVLITYQNWPDRYNEWINVDSYRLAPLRAHVQPKPPPVAVSRMAAAAVSNEERYRQQLEAKHGWQVVSMASDGNCLFRTVAHQVYGSCELHALVRRKCVEYVRAQKSFFRNFVFDEDFDSYVSRMTFDGEWGGEVEIRAMGEIYQRPVEIYAYSVLPRQRYAGPRPHAPPLRLSYHWNSHYNSIVDPATFQSTLCRSVPGELEDQRIRLGARLQDGAAGALSREERELELALRQSRRDFENRDLNEVIAKTMEADLENAKRLSLLHLQGANAPANAAAVAAGAGGLTDDEAAILRAVQAESLREVDERHDLEEAKRRSLRAGAGAGAGAGAAAAPRHQAKGAGADAPLPVQICLRAGFDEMAVFEAYSLFASTDPREEVVADNMMRYLADL